MALERKNVTLSSRKIKKSLKTNDKFQDQIRQRIETQHKLMRGRKQNDVNQIRKASETIYTEQIPSRIDLKTNRSVARSFEVTVILCI